MSASLRGALGAWVDQPPYPDAAASLRSSSMWLEAKRVLVIPLGRKLGVEKAQPPFPGWTLTLLYRSLLYCTLRYSEENSALGFSWQERAFDKRPCNSRRRRG